MLTIRVALNRAMRLDGALGVAIVHYVSRMAPGTAGVSKELDLDRAAQGGTDVVRAHLSALELIGRKPEQLEDILITLDSESASSAR
ncbi:hypothetical protein ACQF4J_32065 [Streptomyces sp. C1-1]|uniref:hypothetical protein n=1 Tax=Streptomyces sp. C1-1 TaxID=3231173 RepID=UPI003D0430F9